jgi:hypothetical protein
MQNFATLQQLWDFNNDGSYKKWNNLPKIVAYLSLLHWSYTLRTDQLADCVRYPWLQAETKLVTFLGN